MLLQLNDDAFGDAQIRSKMELAMSIEHLFQSDIFPELKIDFYAGWYGIGALLLLARTETFITRIRSYDIDPLATEVANRLNRHWRIGFPVFEAYTQDINDLRPQLGEVDLIVNTSVEHMTSREWFDVIPSGMLVALQGTDMAHPGADDPNRIESIEHMQSLYPLLDTHNAPKPLEIKFDYYPGREPFSRFQIIGRKP